MAAKNRTEQTIRDMQKVNLRVDTFTNEVLHNIAKTKREISRRKKAKH